MSTYDEFTEWAKVAREERITNPTTGGQKGRKVERMDLLPWDVLMRDVAPLYAAGAEKYEDHNWRRGYAWSLSIGALGRHFAAFVHGEDLDPENGCPHLAAVVFHAMALLHFMRHYRGGDDRWKPSPGDAGEGEYLAWLSTLEPEPEAQLRLFDPEAPPTEEAPVIQRKMAEAGTRFAEAMAAMAENLRRGGWAS